MTRAELAAYLADFVAHRHLTASEATYLLDLYDSGQLTSADLPQMPQRDNDWLAALLALLLLANVNDMRLAPLPEYQRRRARATLRNGFEAETGRLARNVNTRSISSLTWLTAMWGAVEMYTRQMTIAGAGTMPSAQLQARIDETLTTQAARLQRFGLLIMLRDRVGRALSERLIAARARQYGGEGWGAWFAAHGEDAAWGYVEQWVSRDDQYVCRYCANLHRRYFLPGDGPMPGQGCYGTCRCTRVSEYNPDVYARLIGGGRA